MRNLGNERTSDVPQVMDDENMFRDSEGIVAAKEEALSATCRWLREMQRVCEDGDEAVPTKIVEVNVFACKSCNVSSMDDSMNALQCTTKNNHISFYHSQKVSATHVYTVSYSIESKLLHDPFLSFWLTSYSMM